MPNNVEIVIKQYNVLKRSFKGRLLGVMSNSVAQAVINTPHIGRRIRTESTMTYNELREKEITGLRLVVDNQKEQTIFISPVVIRRPYMNLMEGFEEVEYQCNNGQVYLVKKLVEGQGK